jgi:hypothetical protein
MTLEKEMGRKTTSFAKDLSEMMRDGRLAHSSGTVEPKDPLVSCWVFNPFRNCGKGLYSG